MNFKIKCQIQKIMSLLPNSEKVGYYFSRYITKNLTPNNKRFLLKVNEGFNHLQNFNQFNQLEKNTYNYFDFGAGWTLTIPIVISRMGYKVNCIDYLTILKEIGFTIVKEKTRDTEATDIEKLKSLPIHSYFKNYSLEELGIKDGEIVVRK